MKSLSARRSWWITNKRIGHEETRTDEAESEDAQQDGSPGGTLSGVKHAPESNGKAEYEYSTDEEVGDLNPSLFALAERADKVVPTAEVGASGPFDEKHDDEEQRPDCAADQQESERHWLLSNSLYRCCHSVVFLIGTIEDPPDHRFHVSWFHTLVRLGPCRFMGSCSPVPM